VEELELELEVEEEELFDENTLVDPSLYVMVKVLLPDESVCICAVAPFGP
jgi:hypothetical protein